MAAEIDIPARRRKLMDIWSGIESPTERPSFSRMKSPEFKDYLERVNAALVESRTHLKGLDLEGFSQVVAHEFFNRAHIYPSHAPTFMYPPQPLKGQLQREWTNVGILKSKPRRT